MCRGTNIDEVIIEHVRGSVASLARTFTAKRLKWTGMRCWEEMARVKKDTARIPSNYNPGSDLSITCIRWATPKRLMSRSRKCRVCSRTRSHERVLLSYFLD